MKILSLLRIAVLALVGTAVFIDSDQSNPASFQCTAPTHPDYEALMALYTSTNGDNWTNNTGWGVECDVCLWEGIGCANNRVRSIELQNNNMVGFIPDDFSQLDSLVSIRLRNNQISGTFPATLSELAKLEEISMYNNDLNGSFPTVLFDIPTLNQLDLGFNSLQGPIPNLFDQLPEMKSLILRQNGFVGSFPSTIYLLAKLEKLDMFDIDIGSNLSSDLGNLTSLTHLSLRNTMMAGNLPESIGNLQSLIDLDISYAQIDGDIPNTFYSLSSLENAQMRELGLTGNISSQIGNLKSLKRLDLSHNYLSGVIPSEVAGLDAITELNLGYNDLLGEIPESLYSLVTLQRLDLRDNYFKGQVSNQLSQLSNLTNLTLVRNEFEGEFPDVIGDLPKLKVLYISNNKFSGDFPLSIGESTSLTNVTLSSNYFTGCFPLDYSSLCNVNLASFNLNCTFENPTFSEFCAGAECNNTLNLDAPSLLVCEGETFTIESPTGYTGYEWSVPGQNSSTLVTEASTSQYYYVTITNSRGCTKADSIFINVIPKVFGEETREICDGGSVEINGETYSEAGTFTQTIPLNGACDSTVFVTINQGAGTSGSYSESICSGTTTTINGATFGVGQFTQVITNAAGCDSTIAIEITALPTYDETVEYIVCEGSTYNYNGQELSVGAYVFDYQSMNGCDSTVTVNVIGSSGTSGSYSASICIGTTTTINGATFGVGQFTQVITNTAGCDSTIAIEITALPIYDETVEYIVCEGSTYNYNGQELSVGAHVFDYQSMNGCDSLVTVNVGLSASSSHSVFDEICEGGSVNIAGTEFDKGGEFEVILTNQAGCDSIISVTIVEKPIASTNLIEIICSGQQFLIGTDSYNSSGFYQSILQNDQGCDSIVNLDLTVISGEDQWVEYSICQGDSYAFAGKNYSESITVSDSIIIDGCKSWVTLELTVFDNTIYEYTKSICAGEIEYFFDQVLNESGTYSHTLSSAQNCDSTIIINLNVLALTENTLDTFLCAGASLIYGEETFSEAGNFVVESETDEGCEEVTYLNIDFYEAEKVFVQEFVCDGELVEFEGQSYGAGQYTGTFDDGSCEVEFELTVAELARLPRDEVQTLCMGDVVNFMGETYLSGGQYFIGEELEGCEFLENLIVVEASNETTSIPQIFCQGKSFQLEGESIFTSGIYPVNADSPCSNQFYDVLFVSGEELSITRTILEGSEVIMNNEVFDSAGTYEIMIGEELGCPSKLILTIIVEQCGGIRNESQSICEGESVHFFDQVINTPGSYQHLKKLESGCDSVINLEVELSTIEDFQIEGASFICEGQEAVLSGPAGYDYLWSTGAISSSIWIEQGGVYDLTISNINGCSLTKSMIVEEVKFPNTAIDIIAKDPSSCNAENGSIVIETNDGQNYQYSIDGGLTFQHDSSFVGLANGSYGIVISDDQRRCFKALSTSVKLESAGVPEIDEIKIQGVNDCVGSLGAITVVPAEMNQSYQYSIDGGLTWSPDSVFTSLEVGFYDVQMKLPNSECINNLSTLIEIDAAEALEAEIRIVSALTCTSSFDGILELEIVKGIPPYNILWSNGDTTVETRNLSAGIYTVTIEDSKQCSQILELELSGFEIESLLLDFEDVMKCKDETVRFEVDSNYTYEIYKEGQFYYEASQVELEEAGQYEIIVDLGESCKSSNSFLIENLDVEGSGIDFLLSTEGVKDIEVYGINVSQLQGSSFEWEVSGNAVKVDSIDNYTQGFTFRDTGVYQVSLTGIFNNCRVTLEKSIIIYPDSTFLLNPDDLDNPISLEGFGSWNVYPSPNDGSFEVEIEMLSKKLPATIVIYDVYGSKIIQRDLEGSIEYLESFTLNNVGTGIYNISLLVRDRIFYKNILIVK